MALQPTRRIRMVSLAISLALVLAACGGDDAPEEAAAPDPGAEDAATDDTASPTEPDEGEEADEPAEAEVAEDRGTLTVGLLLPEVGPFAGLASDQIDGFEHYVNDLRDGVLSGYDVDIVTADTANDPAVATENIQRLVERDGVDVIVGVISSAVAYAIAPYVASTGVPLIFTAAAADDLTQRDHSPSIFRVTAAASQYMMPLGTYTCEELGYERAAMVSLDYSFGWEAMGGFARAYEDAGCEIVQELYSPLGTADWGPVVQQIDRDVDVLVQTTTGADAARFLQAYRDFGLTELPMLGHGAGTDPSSLPDPQQQSLAEGVRTILYYAESSEIPANQAFQESFRESYGYVPGLYAEATFTAAMVIEAALAEVDEVSYETLVDAIAGVSLDDAPRGPLQFDEYGQAVFTMYLRDMVQEDGEWVNQEIEVIAEDVTQFWTYGPDEYMAFPTYTDLVNTWAGS